MSEEEGEKMYSDLKCWLFPWPSKVWKSYSNISQMFKMSLHVLPLRIAKKTVRFCLVKPNVCTFMSLMIKYSNRMR